MWGVMIQVLYFDRDEYRNSMHLPTFIELFIKRLKCISVASFKSVFYFRLGGVGTGSRKS